MGRAQVRDAEEEKKMGAKWSEAKLAAKHVEANMGQGLRSSDVCTCRYPPGSLLNVGSRAVFHLLGAVFSSVECGDN